MTAPVDGLTRRAAEVVQISVDALVPYARNARTHSDEQIALIAESIRKFGFNAPVLIGPKGTIIAGHGRVLAAKLLGMVTVPAIPLGHLTEAEIRAYIIADNKLAERAGWDEARLAAELGDLRDLGFDLEGLGFDLDELSALFPPVAGTQGLTEPDAAPEPPAQPISATGDVWALGGHRLLCGDSTVPAAVARALAGVAPNLMVTDPPYGVNYDPAWRATPEFRASRRRANGKATKGTFNAVGKVKNDDQVDWRAAWVLFPGAVVYVWHPSLHCSAAQASLEAAGFGMRAQIIWQKSHFAISRGDYHWQHEPCWYAVRKGAPSSWQGDRKQRTVWEITSGVGFISKTEGEDARTGHGTQKPVECMKRPIENNSRPGDAVYEPFSGSGTTIIAAEMTGRVAHAIEIDPAYVDVAVRRWQDFTGQAARLEDDGRTFAEIAAARAVPAAAE